MSGSLSILAGISPERRRLLLRRLGIAPGIAAGRGAAIPRVPRGKELPLSFAQQRLWFLHQMEPESAVYNVPFAVRLEGDLAPALVAGALTEIVRRHEALRTTFAATDGRPCQVISSTAAVAVPVADLNALPPAARERESARLAAAEARRPFDVEHGPLLRALLLRRQGTDHLALLTVHHLVSDGWSVGLLVEEFCELYAASAGGRTPDLPELPIQYADYACWQRRQLDAAALAPSLEYWRRRLAGAPPAVALPADRPRTAARGGSGAVASSALAPATVASLAALARRAGASLFAGLCAVFGALLARVCGEEDVVFGTVVANRGRAEIEHLIGFFANTLVLRLDLAGAPTFLALLEQSREIVLGAQTHGDVPFDKLVEELAPDRSVAARPLVQAVLLLQSAPAGRLTVPGLALTPVETGSGTAKFDLMLALHEAPDGGLAARLEYATDLFDGATAGRLLAHLANLLAGAAAAPDLRLPQLPLLGEAECHQLRVEWNDTAAGGQAAAAAPGLDSLFAAQARRTPAATAVVSRGARLSYAELASRAADVASRLRAVGAGAEMRVGVMMHRSPDMLAALLGVLAAGAAYVPLDPAYPASRLRFMLADSGAAALLTDGDTPEQLTAPGIPTLRADRIGSGTGAAGAASGPGDPGPDRLAYVMYTSGSTGRPKGVAISHRSALARLRWAAEAYRAEELAGVLAGTSICFDLSVFEIFVPLSRGGAVILADNVLGLLDPAERHGVTLINTVPSAAAELLRCGAVPESARVLNLAGEPLAESLVEEAFRTTRVHRVLNLYGPTEDTTYSTWAELRPVQGGKPTIGRSLACSRLYLLDAAGGQVPIGTPGEIHLAGAGLARGYLDRPDLTAQRFVPDPFATAPGERLYRTGDLGRRLPDGAVEFLGRIDQQVKIHGFRIEPGEVEAVLASHPAVREALALVLPDGAGQPRLTAYVAAPPAAAAELDALLRERLPAYMVPAALVLLAALPRTPNGKPDRAALPAPDWRAASAPAEPRTPYEEILAGIWSVLLGRDQVGTHDSFFALGGHSLLAIRMASKIHAAFGVSLPLPRIFATPTVGALAAAIEAMRLGAAASDRPSLVAVERGPDLPLSFAQQRQWLMAQLDAGSPAHHLTLALRATGTLRPEVLAAALTAAAARHESLRTSFPRRGELPVQAIAPEARLALPRVDLGPLDPARRESAARAVAVEVSRRPFDLEQGPLARAALVLLPPAAHLVVLSAHHLIVDAWSLGLLREQVIVLYRAFAAGKPSPLPPLAFQYADYAAWERRWLESPAVAGQVEYWRSRLAGSPAALALPTTYPRQASRSTRGGRVALGLAPGLVADVAALAARENATPFMVLLAAFQAWLGRLAAQDDVVVGAPVAGRGQAELEGVVGYFINALPLRTYLGGDPSFRDLLGRVREVVLGAYANQDVPFDKLVEELRPKRLPNVPPFFQVVVNFFHGHAAPEALEGVAWSPFELPATEAKYDLTLYLTQEGERLQGALAYRADLWDRSAATLLARGCTNFLADAVADPRRRLSLLRTTTAGERLEQTMKKTERDEARVNKLLNVERKKVQPGRQLTRSRHLDGDGGPPLVVEPTAPDVDLVSWAAAHRGDLEEFLLAHGAVLFRGFRLTVEEFERFARVAAPELVNYVEGSSPRILLGDKVYTSTEYPPELTVSMHNELSYAHKWPRKIMFFCVTVPREGGETPIADSREVFRQISPAVQQRFLDKGVRYVRNLHSRRGAGLSWETVFETDDRAFVESYCREGGIDFRWKDDGGLWTSQVRPAAIAHPQTGEMLWFNQVHQFHPSNLGEEGAAALRALVPEEELPIHATFGDGTPLDAEALDEVRAAYQRALITFPWQECDLLLMDNMLMAHGRMPFSGPRRVVVAMGETVELSSLH